MESPPLVQHVAVADEELPVATPLLRPADGVPAVIDTEDAFDAALAQLAQGTGPFAFSQTSLWSATSLLLRLL